MRGWPTSYPRGAVLRMWPPITQPSPSSFSSICAELVAGAVVVDRRADGGDPGPVAS